jgi:hypothetical protein
MPSVGRPLSFHTQLRSDTLGPITSGGWPRLLHRYCDLYVQEPKQELKIEKAGFKTNDIGLGNFGFWQPFGFCPKPKWKMEMALNVCCIVS